VMVGWPPNSPDEGFAEIYTAPGAGEAEK